MESPKNAIALLAFVLMCGLCSGGHVLSGVMELDTDRRHPTKLLWPFAAGEQYARDGARALLTAFVVVFGVAAFLPTRFFLLFNVYAALILAYTCRIKRVPLVDVTTLFTLHVAIVTTTETSPCATMRRRIGR